MAAKKTMPAFLKGGVKPGKPMAGKCAKCGGKLPCVKCKKGKC